MSAQNSPQSRLLRAVRALSACVDLMVAAQDEPSLLQGVCDVLVQHCGYRLAWIGCIDHGVAPADGGDRGRVSVAARAGEHAGYLDTVEIRWDDSVLGRGPTGVAIRERRPVVCQRVDSDPAFAPWRDRALRSGYRSSVAVPLLDGERTLGALNVYAAEPDAFDDAEIELINHIGQNLSCSVCGLQARAEVLAKAEVLQAVWDCSPDFIALHGADGELLAVNAPVLATMGISADQLAEHADAIMGAGPGGADAARAMVREVAASGEAIATEWIGSDASGEVFPTEVRLRPLTLQAEDGPRVLALVRDMRPLRRAERERLDAERYAALSALAAGIAHDFNNMLTGIVCNLGLARIETDPVERELALREAQEVAASAAGLTRELMTFARAAPAQPAPLDLADVIEKAARFSLRGSAVALDLRLDRDLWWVAGDEVQLRTVVQNLTLNAVHAIGGSGVLTITAQNLLSCESVPTPAPSGIGGVVVRFIDTGPGIPDGILDRVFQPWVSSNVQGRGLGLASAHSIVRAHDGDLSAANLPGGGVCFTIVLPRSSEAVAAAAVAAPAAEVSCGRILVMDDQPAIGLVVVRALTHAGYEATAVLEGSLAVREFERARAADEPYDAAVVDMTVPGGMGGLATLDALQAIDPDVVVVAMSGYTECPTDRFAAFLAKPFAPQQMVRTVANVLAAAQRGNTAAAEQSNTDEAEPPR